MRLTALILNPGQTRRKAKGNQPPKQQDAKPEPADKQKEDELKGFVWNQNYSKKDLT
ncbi:hypothetical protein EBB_03845 [Methylomonas sp. EbB]|uniref:Uncharacterized protein n=1 Tax=Methylomonas fluvii TaxID=1854564 RepID=A0ABR9DCR9_9GAMM|nr:hypothetical protein [Methylomonas fluvii]MBD9359692.1 hypothetical protein [Methylomonas fluvii]